MARWKTYVLTVGQLAAKYLGAGNTDYPLNDDYDTSPSLAVTHRIVNQMRLDSNPSGTMRQLDECDPSQKPPFESRSNL